MPRVEYKGMAAGPLTMQVKNTSDFNEHLTVELSVVNLEYIRIALLQRADEYEEELARKRADMSQGVKTTVYWRNDRKAYIAKRKLDDGSVKYRTVRPRSREPDDMEQSKWADGLADTSDSENSIEIAEAQSPVLKQEDHEDGEAAAVALLAAPAGA